MVWGYLAKAALATGSVLKDYAIKNPKLATVDAGFTGWDIFGISESWKRGDYVGIGIKALGIGTGIAAVVFPPAAIALVAASVAITVIDSIRDAGIEKQEIRERIEKEERAKLAPHAQNTHPTDGGTLTAKPNLTYAAVDTKALEAKQPDQPAGVAPKEAPVAQPPQKTAEAVVTDSPAKPDKAPSVGMA